MPCALYRNSPRVLESPAPSLFVISSLACFVFIFHPATDFSVVIPPCRVPCAATGCKRMRTYHLVLLFLWVAAAKIIVIMINSGPIGGSIDFTLGFHQARVVCFVLVLFAGPVAIAFFSFLFVLSYSVCVQIRGYNACLVCPHNELRIHCSAWDTNLRVFHTCMCAVFGFVCFFVGGVFGAEAASPLDPGLSFPRLEGQIGRAHV